MFDAAGAPITYVGLISVPERGYFRISRRRATRFLGDACSGADACADELRCLPTSDDRGVCALPAPL